MVKNKNQIKTQVTIFLKPEILKMIEKRARRNMMSVSEQVEDILRRSCISMRKIVGKEKLDDALIPLFSRKYRKT